MPHLTEIPGASLGRLPLVLTALVPLFTACPSASYTNPPPTTRFYWPAGLAHIDVPGSPEGRLVVANANFDKRYQSGSILVVDLDQVTTDGGAHLPALGAPTPNGPMQLVNLGATQAIGVNSFTGELASLKLGTNRYRYFVASRSEGMKVQAVDVTVTPDGGTTLSCFPTPTAGHEQDCGYDAPSTTPNKFESTPDGVPIAPSPFGVGVGLRACTTAADCGGDRQCVSGTCRTASGDGFGDVWVTHIQQADSPLASQTNYRGYLVHLESDQMTLDDTSNFIYLGYGATNSVAPGKRWAYTSGRYASSGTSLLRLVGRDGVVQSMGVEANFNALDGRGIALGSNEGRVFLLTRSPDALLVMQITNPTADFPGVALAKAVPLPNSASEVRVIPRAGQGDLVLVTCTGSSLLAVYDEDVGTLVAQVLDIGFEPFALDVGLRDGGARIFVSDFNDGRVAVIDMPSLTRPQETRLVAHLGVQQLCLTNPSLTAGCPGVTP